MRHLSPARIIILTDVTSPLPAPPIAVSMQMSPSVPFLKQPKALDGSMVGDVGFDPLGLSSVADIKFLREAELKHCRVAMLAAAGSMFQDIATDPSFTKIAGGAKMTGLHDKIVAQGGMGQLLVWLGFFEVFGTYALFETLNGKRAPGDFKFDPLGFGKNPEAMKRYQLAEIKNGRLAMLGTGGMVHGYFLTGKVKSASYPTQPAFPPRPSPLSFQFPPPPRLLSRLLSDFAAQAHFS